MSVEPLAVRFARAVALAALVANAACTPGSGSRQPAASQRIPADSALLQPFVGWYRFAELGPALVTWGAETELALMIVRDTMLRVPMIAAGPDSFAVPQPADRPPATVRFTRDAEGNVAALRWSGQRGTIDAPRVRDGEYDPHLLAFTASDGVRLAATLFLPRVAGPHPAAVMVHGSGTSTRNNSWYMTLVDAMASNGIAVLLPDKRGSGASGGDWRTADLELLARDALAGAATLLRHRGVDSSAVGLVGISQGGQIAVSAAVNSPSIRYVVNISGSGVPLNEQLRHEVTQDLRRSAWPGILRPLVRSISLRVIRNRQTEWWERNGGLDPIDEWRTLQVPALVLYGADDEFDNVPVRRSVERLEALSKPNLTIHVFAGSGHALYEPGSQRIRREVLSLLPDWIRQTIALPPSARVGRAPPAEPTRERLADISAGGRAHVCAAERQSASAQDRAAGDVHKGAARTPLRPDAINRGRGRRAITRAAKFLTVPPERASLWPLRVWLASAFPLRSYAAPRRDTRRRQLRPYRDRERPRDEDSLSR